MDGQEHPKAWLFHFFGLTFLALLLTGVALWLGYHYYYGENGYYAVQDLQTQLDKQLEQNELQLQKNNRLRADIKDLKSDTIAIEEHARIDLGLIKPNEIFVQVSPISTPKSDMPTTKNEPNAVEVLEVMVEDDGTGQ